MLAENIKTVEKNIKEACARANRSASDVTLIAVSKTKPVDMLCEVYDTGMREFGENYVQELVEKIDRLPKDIHWHMIGHLQRNKVKYIVGNVTMIHSVDSLRLAEEISKESVKKDVCTEILIEVNVKIRGLMTSAPFVENPEENRKYFRQLKQLSVDINAKNIDNIYMDTLSMGMTNDYVVAVEEGATMVRVGTAIFGARNYNK